MQKLAVGKMAGKMAERDRKNEKGATLVEYALLASLIAIVSIGAMAFVGTRSAETFTFVGCVQGVTLSSDLPKDHVVEGCRQVASMPNALEVLNIMLDD